MAYDGGKICFCNFILCPPELVHSLVILNSLKLFSEICFADQITSGPQRVRSILMMVEALKNRNTKFQNNKQRQI